MKNEIIIAEIVDDISPMTTTRIDHANRLYILTEDQAERANKHAENAIRLGLKLGYILTVLKAETKHGEWGSLFKSNKSPAINTSNSNHGWNLEFGQETARRYMGCYAKAIAKLKGPERQALESGLIQTTTTSEDDDDNLRALIAKASNNAETPRQAMLYWGVIKRTGGDAAPRDDNWRNNEGGPKKEAKTISPEEALEAEKQAATEAWAGLCHDLHQMLQMGRLPLVSRDRYKATRALLATLIEEMDKLNKSQD